jgi:hypothetical protein
VFFDRKYAKIPELVVHLAQQSSSRCTPKVPTTIQISINRSQSLNLDAKQLAKNVKSADTSEADKKGDMCAIKNISTSLPTLDLSKRLTKPPACSSISK